MKTAWHMDVALGIDCRLNARHTQRTYKPCPKLTYVQRRSEIARMGTYSQLVMNRPRKGLALIDFQRLNAVRCERWCFRASAVRLELVKEQNAHSNSRYLLHRMHMNLFAAVHFTSQLATRWVD